MESESFMTLRKHCIVPASKRVYGLQHRYCSESERSHRQDVEVKDGALRLIHVHEGM